MKTIIIFGIIAALGGFAIYFWKENEVLAGLFVALVWGVYERITKEAVKTDRKELKTELKVKDSQVEALRYQNSVLNENVRK